LGAQFLANFFESQLAVSGGKTILVATSGDTGGAVAAAFWKKKNIAVKILFPEDGVSDLQKQQLTCWGKNIESFAVKGSFDDCQAMVKEAFGDRELQDKYHLSSANSINIGRLLPQMTFYFTASAEYLKVTGKVPNFIIPTGNLGNAQACFYARKMGAPIGEVIMATNANNTIPQYFSTGVWEPGETISTLANAMDVAKPSNYERLFALHNDLDSLAAGAKSISVSDEKIKKSIKAVWDKYGMIICPHTATGFVAKEELDIDHAIIVATAHGAKFSSIIKPILGQEIALPESLSKLLKMESSYQSIGTDYRELFSD
jgi:threonine synthase